MPFRGRLPVRLGVRVRLYLRVALRLRMSIRLRLRMPLRLPLPLAMRLARAGAVAASAAILLLAVSRPIGLGMDRPRIAGALIGRRDHGANELLDVAQERCLIRIAERDRYPGWRRRAVRPIRCT